jgi:hypothetical protein
MSANQVNITQYMSGNAGKGSKLPTVSNKVSSNASSTGSGKGSGIVQILSYIFAIFIVIMVILLFIHFFITPIFKLRPGSPGIIPIPGLDDGKLFWHKTNAGQIMNKDLPIAAQTFGYTINLDVFVQNPLQFARHPRIFFSRGATRMETPSGDTLLGILSNYNLVAGLLPDTNDLIVSVLNKDNNMESIVIPNIPVQEAFRLSMVVMEQALEVYVNGQLMRTRSFSAPPKSVEGDIYPAAGVEANIVKVKNLKIWARILTTSEIRAAKPPLSNDFGNTPMPATSVCGVSSNDMMADLDKVNNTFYNVVGR